ncbi:MAG: hypothetical protein JXN63_05400 [Candidatus Delongbacteria bacterium]|nr:hypothetical protein [Candidatus Delongbacteria bacterium]
MKYLTILALILFSFISAASNSPAEDPVPSWQQSESPGIQLGVRDKNGSAEEYEALFVVSKKSGTEKFEKNIKVKKDDWGFVYFPSDFKAASDDGEYEWKCFVDGKVVSYGEFIYSEYQRILTLPKKDK